MKILGKNKKAYFDFSILSKLEAGIMLEGWEVKSIKAGNFSLKESFVIVKNDGVYLTGMHVSRWRTQSRNIVINEYRERKLLLKNSEIEDIKEKVKSEGMTALVLSLYLQGNKIKVEVGLARGKKKYDKREALKKKEFRKEMKHTGERW